MANREALRAMQTRLAERLQTVQSESGASLQWLAVRAADRRYLIPLSQAGEIFPWRAPKAVPYTQPWFWGVANLRGSLTGVVDLACLMGAEGKRTEPRMAQASIITLHPSLEFNAGLVVDQLLGLRGEKDFSALPDAKTDADVTTATAETDGVVGATYLGVDGERWQELSLPCLLQSPAFLQVRI